MLSNSNVFSSSSLDLPDRDYARPFEDHGSRVFAAYLNPAGIESRV